MSFRIWNEAKTWQKCVWRSARSDCVLSRSSSMISKPPPASVCRIRIKYLGMNGWLRNSKFSFGIIITITQWATLRMCRVRRWKCCKRWNRKFAEWKEKNQKHHVTYCRFIITACSPSVVFAQFLTKEINKVANEQSKPGTHSTLINIIETYAWICLYCVSVAPWGQHTILKSKTFTVMHLLYVAGYLHLHFLNLDLVFVYLHLVISKCTAFYFYMVYHGSVTFTGLHWILYFETRGFKKKY